MFQKGCFARSLRNNAGVCSSGDMCIGLLYPQLSTQINEPGFGGSAGIYVVNVACGIRSPDGCAV